MYGARVLVFLKYDGTLEELAKILGDKMEIPEIYFDTDMDPPHDVFAMSEFAGFELWLKTSNEVDGFNFEIEIRTTMSPGDATDSEMFDLSPWFAKEITGRCGIETEVKS